MVVVVNLDTANPVEAIGSSRHYAVAIASFNRPNSTTAYAALDCIGDDVAASAVLKFPDVGKGGAILSSTIAIEEAKTITPRLFLFDSVPTNILDNAKLLLVTGDMPKLIGYFDYVEADKLVVGAAALNFYTASAAIGGGELLGHPVPFASADGNLYGLLQTVPGYTPAVSVKFTVRLQLELNG